MTDIVDELKQIKSILNVLYSKVERLEGQVAYCVDALIDLNESFRHPTRKSESDTVHHLTSVQPPTQCLNRYSY
jgi:hypothetical protein